MDEDNRNRDQPQRQAEEPEDDGRSSGPRSNSSLMVGPDTTRQLTPITMPAYDTTRPSAREAARSTMPVGAKPSTSIAWNLGVSGDERVTIEEALDRLVRERAGDGESGTPHQPDHIGIGTK